MEIEPVILDHDSLQGSPFQRTMNVFEKEGVAWGVASHNMSVREQLSSLSMARGAKHSITPLPGLLQKYAVSPQTARLPLAPALLTCYFGFMLRQARLIAQASQLFGIHLQTLTADFISKDIRGKMKTVGLHCTAFRLN